MKKTFFTILTALIFCGCANTELFKKKENPLHLLYIYRYATPDLYNTNLMQQIIDDDGEKVHVRKIPVLTSKNIFRIEATEKENGKYIITLYTDRHGYNLWFNHCATNPGCELAIVLDGFYRFSIITPSGRLASNKIELSGEFSKLEAEKIALWGEKNYKILND